MCDERIIFTTSQFSSSRLLKFFSEKIFKRTIAGVYSLSPNQYGHQEKEEGQEDQVTVQVQEEEKEQEIVSLRSAYNVIPIPSGVALFFCHGSRPRIRIEHTGKRIK